MRARITVLLAGAALLVGCGVHSVETSFDERLVKDVGQGSLALAGIEQALTHAAQARDGANNVDYERSMRLLLTGRLDQLSEEDIALLEEANAEDLREFDVSIRRIDNVAREIGDAQVGLAAHADVTAGTGVFIRRWNAYLSVNAGRLGRLRSSLAAMRQVFAKLDGLLQAARETAELGHAREMKPLRDRFLAFAQRTGRDAGRTLQGMASEGIADRRLRRLVNSDREANALVGAVNEDYPEGWLAAATREQ